MYFYISSTILRQRRYMWYLSRDTRHMAYTKKSVRYIPITSTTDVTSYVSSELINAISAGKSVTWLLSGGSAIPLIVEIAKTLSEHDLSKLHVTLTDERYGPLGHSNENWWQLEQAGFALPGADTYRVLQPGLIQAETAAKFGEKLQEFFASSDLVFGFFGMGSDGHTAGIKPGSFDMTTDAYAVDYSGEDFERITMTPKAIRQVGEAVLYAAGEAKRPALISLMEEDLPIEEQPAQILKRITNWTIFTDIKF